MAGATFPVPPRFWVPCVPLPPLWHVTHATLYVALSQFDCARTRSSPDVGMFPEVYVVWQFRQICVVDSTAGVLSAAVVRRFRRLFACGWLFGDSPYEVW